jgi:hypothetical protein
MSYPLNNRKIQRRKVSKAIKMPNENLGYGSKQIVTKAKKHCRVRQCFASFCLSVV